MSSTNALPHSTIKHVMYQTSNNYRYPKENFREPFRLPSILAGVPRPKRIRSPKLINQ